MPLPSVIEVIDRLFDELVRVPWVRPGQVTAADTAYFDAAIPLAGGERNNVLVAVEGQRLIVTIRRPAGAAGAIDTAHPPQERTFLLPDDSDVRSIEARFEGDVLHIRVGLRRARQ